jgi:hypothetical protein
MEQEKLIYQLLKLIFAPVDGANFSVDIHSFFVDGTIKKLVEKQDKRKKGTVGRNSEGRNFYRISEK